MEAFVSEDGQTVGAIMTMQEAFIVRLITGACSGSSESYVLSEGVWRALRDVTDSGMKLGGLSVSNISRGIFSNAPCFKIGLQIDDVIRQERERVEGKPSW